MPPALEYTIGAMSEKMYKHISVFPASAITLTQRFSFLAALVECSFCGAYLDTR